MVVIDLLNDLSLVFCSRIGLNQCLEVDFVDAESEFCDLLPQVYVHRYNAEQIVLDVFIIIVEIEVKILCLGFLLHLCWRHTLFLVRQKL